MFAGDKALRQILDDAVKIADRSTDRQQAEAICKSVGNMRTMVDTLSELRQQGKVMPAPATAPRHTCMFVFGSVVRCTCPQAPSTCDRFAPIVARTLHQRDRDPFLCGSSPETTRELRPPHSVHLQALTAVELGWAKDYLVFYWLLRQ